MSCLNIILNIQYIGKPLQIHVNLQLKVHTTFKQHFLGQTYNVTLHKLYSGHPNITPICAYGAFNFKTIGNGQDIIMRYKETQQYTPNFEKFEHMLARHKSDLQLSKIFKCWSISTYHPPFNSYKSQSHTHSQQIHTLMLSKAFVSQKNKIHPVCVIRI